MKRGRKLSLLWSACAVALGCSSTTNAVDGTWEDDAGGNWIDTTTAPWLNAIVADGAGFSALFTADITANRTVTLTAARTIGNLTFSDTSHTWTLSGTFTLTLNSTGEATPVVDLTVNDRQTTTVNVLLSSTEVVEKEGIGTLVLTNASNTFAAASGPGLIVNGGIAQIGTTIAPAGGRQVRMNAGGVFTTDFNLTQADIVNATTGIDSASTGSLALNAPVTGLDLSGHTGLFIGARVGQTITQTDLVSAAADSSFRFGGGGGTLIVPVNLADGSGARTLNVASPASTANASGGGHLTIVRLTGTNTFTGNTTVGQFAALQYASPAAMGASAAARPITVNNAGLVSAGPGHTFANLQTELLDRIATTSTGVFAISQDESANLNFSQHTALRFGAIGTATYSGTLTANSDNLLRVGGGGTLTITSQLPAGITGIDVNVQNASGVGRDATVRFTGNNSALNVPITVGNIAAATDGLALLQIGANSEIGSGTITVANNSGRVRLLDGAVLANNVVLASAGGGSKVFGADGAAVAVTMNGNLTSSDTGDRENDLDVPNTAVMTMNGIISGAGDLEKTGAGTLILTNPASALTQRFDATAGVVQFTFNVPSTFANTAANAGIFSRGGTIELVDGITITEGITFDNSGGTRAIRLLASTAFTGTVTNVTLNDATAGYDHDFNANNGILTVAGNVSGTAVSGIDIQGNGPGQGTVVFAGGTGYTKEVRLESGFFRISEEADLGLEPAAFVADHLLLSAGHLDTVATFTIDDPNRGISLDASSAIRVADGTTLTIAVPLAGASNTVAYVKRGNGTLVLTRAATSIADFSANHGTVRLDFSAAGAPSSQILVDAAGTLLSIFGSNFELIGAAGATNTQTVNATNFDPGDSAVIVQAGAGGTMTFGLGTVGRVSGAVVDFSLNAGAAATTPTGTAGTLLTANSIAYATVGNVDWAAKDAGNTNIVAATYTDNTATTLAGNANVVATDTTLAAGSTPDSIRFNEAAARTITVTGQTLTTGGILVTPNVGANAVVISGGTLRAANTAATDLPIIQNNTAADLTISSVIENNTGAKALTKAGAGRLVLTGANTYTGQTWLMDGTLSISSNANLGLPSTGAKITVDGGILEATATFALDNAGANIRAVTLGDRGGIFKVTGSNRLTISGVIDRDGTDTTINGLTKTDTGTLLIRGVNIYNGPTTVSGGVLQVGDNTSTTATTGLSSTRSVLTVAASATLTGTGTVVGAGAATPHSIAGFLSPGATTSANGDGEAALRVNGELTMAAGSTATLSLATPTGNAGAGVNVLNLPTSHPGLVNGAVALNTHDQVVVSHKLTLSGGGTIVVDAATLGSYASPAAGDVFNIIDAASIVYSGFNAGPRFQTGAEAGQDLDLPVLGGGLQWDTGLLQSHGVLAVVPEPACMTLLAAAAGALLLRRRRVE